MSGRYILAIDQGTTSTRALLFNSSGEAVFSHSKTHKQLYPHPGWVSHDGLEIIANTLECIKAAVNFAGVHKAEILAIGITNQRETIVAWDKETGEPVCDAIVWQCKRTTEICEKIKADGFDKTATADQKLVSF